jgi:UDP-3-O-[3-hydroxymyristoyl] glucosamine N-acyltransferase
MSKFSNIADDAVLGKNVLIRDFVNLYGCNIGDHTKIASFVEIQKGATVGSNCKISCFAVIVGGVHIEDGCFIGSHRRIHDQRPYYKILPLMTHIIPLRPLLYPGRRPPTSHL